MLNLFGGIFSFSACAALYAVGDVGVLFGVNAAFGIVNVLIWWICRSRWEARKS